MTAARLVVVVCDVNSAVIEHWPRWISKWGWRQPNHGHIVFRFGFGHRFGRGFWRGSLSQRSQLTIDGASMEVNSGHSREEISN